MSALEIAQVSIFAIGASLVAGVLYSAHRLKVLRRRIAEFEAAPAPPAE